MIIYAREGSPSPGVSEKPPEAIRIRFTEPNLEIEPIIRDEIHLIDQLFEMGTNNLFGYCRGEVSNLDLVLLSTGASLRRMVLFL